VSSRQEFIGGNPGAVVRLANQVDRPIAAHGLLAQKLSGNKAPEREIARPWNVCFLKFVGRAHIDQFELRVFRK
jgi:hypothetical protein